MGKRYNRVGGKLVEVDENNKPTGIEAGAKTSKPNLKDNAPEVRSEDIADEIQKRKKRLTLGGEAFD